MIEPTDIPGRLPLAYRNQEFRDAPDARPLRILSEYLYPLTHFRKQKIRDTIVFFGSARTFEASASGRYYTEARQLAARLTDWSDNLDDSSRRFVVCTGGGPGIMEAANRGAAEAGGKTVGLNIGLPMEQRPNPFITPGLNFEFHYFFMRKYWFAYLAKALVVFPGGFGTLDEFFEILTLAQTRKLAKKILVIVYGKEYWKRVLNLEALVDAGTISPEDLNGFTMVDTPEEALEVLREGLTRYHLQPQTARPVPDEGPEIAQTLP